MIIIIFVNEQNAKNPPKSEDSCLMLDYTSFGKTIPRYSLTVIR